MKLVDKRLLGLVLLSIVVDQVHDIDHFIRGDLSTFWGVTSSIAKAGFLALAVLATLRAYVGATFWFAVTGVSAFLVWLVHLSPFSLQSPQFICRAYPAPIGFLTAAMPIVLEIVLVVTAIHAHFLMAGSYARRQAEITSS